MQLHAARPRPYLQQSRCLSTLQGRCQYKALVGLWSRGGGGALRKQLASVDADAVLHYMPLFVVDLELVTSEAANPIHPLDPGVGS